MTHDQKCKFDPKYCRDCQLQAEARESERETIAFRISQLKTYTYRDIRLVDWNFAMRACKDSTKKIAAKAKETSHG